MKWTQVGRFLSMLTMLDTATLHPVMQTGWLEYKRMVKAIRFVMKIPWTFLRRNLKTQKRDYITLI